MKGPKFLYLVAIAAAVALVAWFMHRAERNAWQAEAITAGSKVLGDFAVNDVASAVVSGPDGRVTLRRGDKVWGVAERADYPADFARVSELILKLANLEALQSVPVAESDYGVLALRTEGDRIPREEAGTKVELQDKSGQAIASVVLGKMHMTAPPGIRPELGGTTSGRYVMPGGRKGPAYLVAETFSDLQASPAQWIDKTFIRPGMPRRIEAKSRDGFWVLERESSGAPWTMEGLRKSQSLDMNKAMSLDSMLTTMTVADVPDGAEDARTKPLENDPVTLTADTFEGVRYVLTIGRGDGDNLPVRVSAEALPGESSPATDEAKKVRDEKLAAAEKFKDRIVLIPRNFLAPFLEPRAALLAKPGVAN